MADLAFSTVAQGLMWSILAIGVFLSFRVLDVPDMTCEGSFPLGGAIAASMIAAGASPWLAIAAGAFGGLLAGIVTGILYTKLKIPAILAGILTMIALYSVNLHVMGKANISLLRVDTIFSTTASLLHVSNSVAAFLVPQCCFSSAVLSFTGSSVPSLACASARLGIIHRWCALRA